MCLRDKEGNFVLVKTMCITPICTVVVGEALGLFYSLQWLSDTKSDNVDFVLDSKVTVDAFHNKCINVMGIWPCHHNL